MGQEEVEMSNEGKDKGHAGKREGWGRNGQIREIHIKAA